MLSLGAVALGLASGLSLGSCADDKFEQYETKSPDWLGDNIYDYLTERGDCKNFIRLIDDANLTETMRKTGSNTVFFCNDEAFERFYANNSLGIRRYEDMPQSLKSMFIRFGVIENAQLIERLSLSDNGNVILRRTTNMEVRDTIPVVNPEDLPMSDAFDKLRAKGKPVRLLQDASRWTLVQFFPTVMRNKNITDADLQFITGNPQASTENAYLYSNMLLKQNVVCKNGYLHELQDVLLPPDNMAGYIRSEAELSEFAKLMDRFAVPKYYGRTSEGDSIYELKYFNTGVNSYIRDAEGNSAPATLIFDPGWNCYESTTSTARFNRFEETMGCIFAPTNQAMKEFFSATGEGADFYTAFGSWDNVPVTMVADIINANMKHNFLQALPSKFEVLEDESGYSMGVKQSDINNTFISRNGVVYITNKVLAPQDYKTVMGPAKINLANKIFNLGISNTAYSYYAYILRAPMNSFYFFITPDEYMKGYEEPVTFAYTSPAYHTRLDFSINKANNIVATPVSIESGDTISVAGGKYALGENGVVSSGMKYRMKDILGSQTVVCSYNGELEERLAQGQEWFVTNSYAPIHLKSLAVGAVVEGSNSAHQATILKAYQKSNGKAYEIDGLLQNTHSSVFDVLSSREEYKEFFNICEAIGIFASSAADKSAALNRIVSFLTRYHYTVYVPTNRAIRQAQQEGKIPTVDAYERETDKELKDAMEERLINFVRYHFQDNSIFIKGAHESDVEYLSSTLNPATKKFYPIKVTNTGSSITLTDAKGGVAHVVAENGLCNQLARDIILNAQVADKATEISSYAYAVIHQIDKVLEY